MKAAIVFLVTSLLGCATAWSAEPTVLHLTNGGFVPGRTARFGAAHRFALEVGVVHAAV